VAARSWIGLALAAIVAAALGAVAAPAAHAKGSLLGLSPKCGPTSKPFSQFGDYRNYTFAPDGGLESGGVGWSLSGGAKVVSGNETFFVHSRYDSRSLYLPAGSTVTTPPMCMGTFSTWIRFFSKSNGSGSLKVQVQFRSLLGSIVGLLNWATIGGSSSWTPSPSILNLQSLNSILGANAVQLKLTAVGAPFQIDDVYVDPWASSD
jgi:hypothetical protein